jgi:hypothetical protein
MGKNAGRILVLGFAMAVAGALTTSVNVSAGETLPGACGTTPRTARTEGLALDLGAPLSAPGRPTAGLDSAAPVAAQEKSAAPLSLPVSETVKTLGVGRLLAIDRICTTAQGTVNTVGDTFQAVLGGASGAADSPEHTSGRPDPRPVAAGGAADPTVPDSGNRIGAARSGFGRGTDATPGVVIGAVFRPGEFAVPVIAPSVPPGRAPSLGRNETSPVVSAGTARSLPASNAPAKLPLLFAVLLLAVVAAALIRSWIRRDPA